MGYVDFYVNIVWVSLGCILDMDIIRLRDFYTKNPLGRVAAQKISDCLVRFLKVPHMGDTVVGYGFSSPVLEKGQGLLAQADDTSRLIHLMPSRQGAIVSLYNKANTTVLCEETAWPLASGFVDSILVMHGLEYADSSDVLMEEVGRVLSSKGRAFFVVANRAGLWALSDATPFGCGRPYSRRQLETLLNRHHLVVEHCVSVLFMPPVSKGFWFNTASLWESLGKRLSTVVPWLSGGVIIVEARKNLTPPTLVKKGAVFTAKNNLKASATVSLKVDNHKLKNEIQR